MIEYTEQVRGRTFYAAYEKGSPIGFISIKENNEFTAEIYVIGVLPAYHRQGTGKALIHQAEKVLREKRYRFLTVKTLSDAHPDENYGRTRAFYRGTGFYPLEELKDLWGEQNPCLIMVKSI